MTDDEIERLRKLGARDMVELADWVANVKPGDGPGVDASDIKHLEDRVSEFEKARDEQVSDLWESCCVSTFEQGSNWARDYFQKELQALKDENELLKNFEGGSWVSSTLHEKILLANKRLGDAVDSQAALLEKMAGAIKSTKVVQRNTLHWEALEAYEAWKADNE